MSTLSALSARISPLSLSLPHSGDSLLIAVIVRTLSAIMETILEMASGS